MTSQFYNINDTNSIVLVVFHLIDHASRKRLQQLAEQYCELCDAIELILHAIDRNIHKKYATAEQINFSDGLLSIIMEYLDGTSSGLTNLLIDLEAKTESKNINMIELGKEKLEKVDIICLKY